MRKHQINPIKQDHPPPTWQSLPLSAKQRWQRVQQGLLAGGIVAIILLVVWFNQLFAGARLGLTDIYFVPTDVSTDIVIIALDDQSLEVYGRTPTLWSRAIYADLIAVLDEAGARVAAFDLLFSDETPEDATLAAAITAARAGDTRLRTVMAAGGVYPAGPATNQDEFPHALHFDNALHPTTVFADVIDYQGFVNTFPDADGIVRRQPSLLEIGDDLSVSWSVATVLAYLRIPAETTPQIMTYADGVLQIGQQRQLYVDDLGLWPQYFFGPPANVQSQTFPIFSLADVLTGDVDPTVFQDKIVLIGLINSTGVTDRYAVPSATRGQLMTGVEIQANAVETLLQSRAVRPLNNLLHAALIVLLAVGSSLLYLPLRWTYRLVAGGALLGVWIILAFVVFALTNQIIYLFDTGLSLIIPVLVTTGLEITNEINRRRQSEFILQSMAQVSQQRLMVDRILPQIAADVRSLVPRAEVTIWRWETASQQAILIYPTVEKSPHIPLTEIAQQVGRSREPVIERLQVILPIAWQQRLVGIYAIQTPANAPLSADTVGLLRRLAIRLAPNLENAFLYTALEQQNAVQDAILHGSPAGIVVLANDTRVDRLNVGLDELFKVSTAQYVGQPLPDLFTALTVKEKNTQAVIQALDDGQPFQQQLTAGSSTFNLAAAPLAPFGLWVLVITEITYLIQLNELKTYMLRMLSHDLGNPLSRILGYSQLLIHDEAMQSETASQFLEYIINDGEEMDRIITDVLNLEHTRSAEIVLEKIDLTRLIKDIVERNTHEMTARQQIGATDLPNEPVYVAGNRRQLIQAITNLLSNAIKYTPAGGHVSLKLTPAVDDTIQLVVADTGYGIPEDSQANIFKEFYRVKTQATTGITGSGLGLSLVKVVVEAHQGRIWFDSVEEVGSKFYIELPKYKETT